MNISDFYTLHQIIAPDKSVPIQVNLNNILYVRPKDHNSAGSSVVVFNNGVEIIIQEDFHNLFNKSGFWKDVER